MQVKSYRNLNITLCVFIEELMYPFGGHVHDRKAMPEDDMCRDVYDYNITMFGNSFSQLYVCISMLVRLKILQC